MRSDIIIWLLQSWSDPEPVNDPELVKWLYYYYLVSVIKV